MFQLQLSSLNCKGTPVCTLYAPSATTMDSGYPLDWFKETVESDLICEICGKVLHVPRATPCGHIFCLRCVEFWIEYYGICPKRCGEIDVDGLSKDPQVEKRIMELPVHCKYNTYGCEAKVALADKQKHEKKCTYKSKQTTASPSHGRNSFSQDTYVEMASVAPPEKSRCIDSKTKAKPPHPGTTTELAYHTYHLTRKAPGESLGFVLVAGAKNSNGRAVNFSIKTVNPGSVAAEVGLLPGDKILQVDHIGLSQMTSSEAVSRIKDNPEVTITVLRAHHSKSTRTAEDHVYEDILYSDIQENSPHHPNMSGRNVTSMGLLRKKSDPLPNSLHRPANGQHRLSPSYGSDPPTARFFKPLSEKISIDSGLSSSTNSSQQHHRQQQQQQQQQQQPIYHQLEPPNMHHLLKAEHSTQDRRGSTGSNRSRNIQIDGNYEVEEIFLQKSSSNQLGITLGYDTTSTAGSLFVCEIIPTGLAAKDGRIKKGDIIRKVNGFEVYDPEEAVLLFLEQDQDISLTVARKLKTLHIGKGMTASKSQNSLLRSLAAIDSCNEDNLRRTDSCGSLDSRTHNDTGDVPLPPSSRRYSESSTNKSQLSPRVPCSPSTSLGTSSTDYTFKPIQEGRPSTATEFNNFKLMRSSTSIGSAPEASRNSVQALHHKQMSRHHSLEAARLRSISPVKYHPPNTGYIRQGRGDNHHHHHHQTSFDKMYRSVSNVRCESLV